MKTIQLLYQLSISDIAVIVGNITLQEYETDIEGLLGLSYPEVHQINVQSFIDVVDNEFANGTKIAPMQKSNKESFRASFKYI